MHKSRLEDLAETCRTIALQIEERDFRHVSVIFNKNRLVAMGTNMRKSHPAAAKKGYRFNERHSELSAWAKVPYSLRNGNLTLVNFRFNKRGEMRLAKPCQKCQIWCHEIFRHIYWSTDNGQIIKG